ncbi:helix-turn-helix domain-containing protein [Leifsonia poae]|uniref:helix-turn-helix domain-containing protein n=1 Tax=Leifsonia poae TaxID=110933 RepID=UPI003D66E8FF
MGENNEPASTGQIAADRLRSIRTGQQMSLRQLAERVNALGYPLSLAMINRIELGLRRMDVDDLTALAAALGVAPAALLMDLDVRSQSDIVSATGVQGDAEAMWDWLTGQKPPPGYDDDDEVFRHIRFGLPFWIRAGAAQMTWQDFLSAGVEPEERARWIADRLGNDIAPGPEGAK